MIVNSERDSVDPIYSKDILMPISLSVARNTDTSRFSLVTLHQKTTFSRGSTQREPQYLMRLNHQPNRYHQTYWSFIHSCVVRYVNLAHAK